MFEEFAQLDQDHQSEILEGFIPEVYFARQSLQNLVNGPVMSKKAALRVNMARVDQALARGDRKEFARLARERQFIQREWLD